MRIATFVHISDLHFGLIDPQTRDARAPRLWAKWKHFDGLLGHSYRSLVRLAQFSDRLRNDENAKLIISGDFTTVGNNEEFETAEEYLGDLLRPPKGNLVGLRDRRWQRLAVPGNHDHWPGTATIFGGPTDGYLQRFIGYPLERSKGVSEDLGDGRRLRFLLLDSDADVSPYGPWRVLARGAFASQLKQLAGSLDPPKSEEVRVLILHHSYSAVGPTLAINSASKASLHDFIAEHDISVVLCGHVHQPPVIQVLDVSWLKQRIKFLEARCGTTTQTSTLPYDWTTVAGNRPVRQDHWPNTLLVHRLFNENGVIVWEAMVYVERPWGFGPAEEILPSFPHTRRFVVWPAKNRAEVIS